MIYHDGDFANICNALHHQLMEAMPVTTESWQALKNVPHTATRELQMVTIETRIPQTPAEARLEVDPNLPWADMHFEERVGGVPCNPPPSHTAWPWYSATGEARKDGVYSHSYPERMWGRAQQGQRYRYGDLDDVVSLLHREPHTRQAVLPIWWPEDVGAHHQQRVPCSLFYQFMLRGELLHVIYTIRSCDFLRYLRDDVYLAMRLGQWVLDQLTHLDHSWGAYDMGILHMHISSLHVFEGDLPKMRRTAPAKP